MRPCKNAHFTFHSGYILMLCILIHSINSVDLYIPFWLYSNLPAPAVNIFVHFLYIPFWLYSNEAMNGWEYDNSKLYIPFWLYSNAIALNSKSVMSPFTFHSGYILIFSKSGYHLIQASSYNQVFFIENSRFFDLVCLSK